MKTPVISSKERGFLRDFARRVAEIASTPDMVELRDLWRRHNRMEQVRPVVFVAPQGAWPELVTEEMLVCRNKDAREIEKELRKRIYVYEHFSSDNVLEKEWVVKKNITNTGWGLEVRTSHSDTSRGAYGLIPVIADYSDLKKLEYPEVLYDEVETNSRFEFFQDLFGDILDVKLKGIDDLSYHLMKQYTGFRGLENTLFDMMENPHMVHEAMEFFQKGHQRILSQYIEQDLLGANTDNTPIYTSGHGYTDEFSSSVTDGATATHPSRMWGWAEAQEMAMVSPDMHEEFVFPYEKKLLEPFGLNGYGCCDDVTRKLDFVLSIPRLRRVSVSPWGDVERCAERINNQVIFMWKPQPAHLVGTFSPESVEQYLRHTVEVAKRHGCTLEIVLLDTHTCEFQPARFDKWTEIAREVTMQ